MIEKAKQNWNQNRGGAGKHGLQGPGIPKLDSLAHKEASNSLAQKTIFKKKLFSLFEQGKTPENITNEDLAQILDISSLEIPINREEQRQIIHRKLRNMFSTATNKPELIRFQYQLYLENKRQI